MPYSRKEIIGLGFTSSAELLVEMGKCKALLDERAAATIKAMEAEWKKLDAEFNRQAARP